MPVRNWRKRQFAAVMCLGTLAAMDTQPTAVSAADRRARDLLRGAVDLHMHTAPDVFARNVSAYEAAMQAKEAGMRAIVVKSHTVDTAARAELVSGLTGFPVFGGIALNYGVGGFNWHAVRESHWQGGREVWMPTLSARRFFEHGRNVPLLYERVPLDLEDGLIACGPDGEVTSEVRRVIDLIAETGQILSTGHLAPEEGLAVLRYAAGAGVRAMLVTHPHADFVGYTVDQMREAAALGAALEMHYTFTTPVVDPSGSMATMAELIRAVGPENCVIATDGGRADLPAPVELLRLFIAGLLEHDFDAHEIRLMSSELPLRVLGTV
jgi:hypothetical protein